MAALTVSATPIVRLTQVCKDFQTPAGSFRALDGIDLAIGQGEYVGIVGKSGSGKTTMLNMITGIDRPSQGQVAIAGQVINELGESRVAALRGRKVGIVFQFFQLLPTLSVLENIMLPMDFAGLLKPNQRRERALGWLERVGVADQAHKLPATLSGGQQQRVAIARALANDPDMLVADEPTGNLDSRTAESVYRIFADLVESGKTIVLVSHDSSITSIVERTVRLVDGRIVEDTGTAALAARMDAASAAAREAVHV
jgi:putative ABC transport system ATP-binding protein